VELFRQPDMQFVTAENPIGHALHFGEWGLTMGQVLSAPMIVTGLALIFYSFSHFGSAADQRLNTVV
jgi:phosphatidylglycerol:prolipoprotein diacylglycerol transferase